MADSSMGRFPKARDRGLRVATFQQSGARPPVMTAFTEGAPAPSGAVAGPGPPGQGSPVEVQRRVLQQAEVQVKMERALASKCTTEGCNYRRHPVGMLHCCKKRQNGKGHGKT